MGKIDFQKKKLGVNPKAYMGTSAKGYEATEIVYNNVAINKILPEIGCTDVIPSTELEVYLANRADGKQAMDHFLVDSFGTYLSVQTRFRAPKYEKYKDFTVRYDKPSATAYTGKPVECEFYHFNADLMIYGICDEDLMEKDATGKNIGAEKVTDFKCWVVVNLAVFRNLCKTKKIMQQENLKDKDGKFVDYLVDGGTLICAIKSNKGTKDTRFTTISVKKCIEMFPELIIAQKNFV